MNAKWFAGRLKELRNQAGLTQPELAEKCGISKGGLADIEQGRNSPSWETVVALCQALGVKCDVFLEPPSSEAEPQGRGRPKKEADTGDEGNPPEKKKPRGRPKKVKGE